MGRRFSLMITDLIGVFCGHLRPNRFAFEIRQASLQSSESLAPPAVRFIGGGAFFAL
jgi:hypothetical protein